MEERRDSPSNAVPAGSAVSGQLAPTLGNRHPVTARLPRARSTSSMQGQTIPPATASEVPPRVSSLAPTHRGTRCPRARPQPESCPSPRAGRVRDSGPWAQTGSSDLRPVTRETSGPIPTLLAPAGRIILRSNPGATSPVRGPHRPFRPALSLVCLGSAALAPPAGRGAASRPFTVPAAGFAIAPARTTGPRATSLAPDGSSCTGPRRARPSLAPGSHSPLARSVPGAARAPGSAASPLAPPAVASCPPSAKSLDRSVDSNPKTQGATRQRSTHKVVGARWPVGSTPSSQRGQTCASARK